MRNYKREQKVHAFSKHVRGTTVRNRISKTFEGKPGQIKITLADGTIKYKNQTRAEVITAIQKGNNVGRRKK